MSDPSAFDRRPPRHVAMFVRHAFRSGAPWLTIDLARALVRAGCTVTLFVYASADEPTGDFVGVHIRRLEFPLRLAKGRRWRLVLIPISHVRNLFIIARDLRSNPPDVTVRFTSFALFAGVGLLRSVRRSHRVGIVWDFYPVQRIQMGLARSGLVSRAVYFLEHKGFQAANQLLLMTEGNRRYMADYHGPLNASTEIVYLWRDIDHFDSAVAERPIPAKLDHQETLVFGGALTAGRDISFLVSIASELARTRPTCKIVIAGSGTGLDAARRACTSENVANVEFLGALAQGDYHRLLTQASAGLVVTSATVDSPSLPSKTLDYLAARLPVLALVNEATDFGDLIEREWRCGVAAPVGDVGAACNAVVRCLDDHRSGNSMGRRGRTVLEHDLTSDHVARTIAMVRKMPAKSRRERCKQTRRIEVD
jgi:glycosyltransferase involved in cell wall biosynthesis